MTTMWKLPTSPCPSTGSSWLVPGLVVLVVLFLFVCLMCCACQGEVGERGGQGLALCCLPRFLLHFFRRKGPPLCFPDLLGLSGLALILFPWITPPSPTSPAPLEGEDHISPPILELMVTSSPWPSLGGQASSSFFRAPSQGREVVSASTGR